jgi:hypothetical protein
MPQVGADPSLGFVELRMSVLPGRFLSSQLPPNCCQRWAFNKLPVAITLPFPIGAILIGTFAGTSMKEKQFAIWAFDSALSTHLTIPFSLFSFPFPSSPPPLSWPCHSPFAASLVIGLLLTLQRAADSMGWSTGGKEGDPRILLRIRNRKLR